MKHTKVVEDFIIWLMNFIKTDYNENYNKINALHFPFFVSAFREYCDMKSIDNVHLGYLYKYLDNPTLPIFKKKGTNVMIFHPKRIKEFYLLAKQNEQERIKFKDTIDYW